MSLMTLLSVGRSAEHAHGMYKGLCVTASAGQRLPLYHGTSHTLVLKPLGKNIDKRRSQRLCRC